MASAPVLTYINDYGARMPLIFRCEGTPARWMKIKAAKVDNGRSNMKAFFLTGSAALLLACGVTVFPAMAGGKIVNLTLRVLVDGPPPCSVKEARWSSAM